MISDILTIHIMSIIIIILTQDIIQEIITCILKNRDLIPDQVPIISIQEERDFITILPRAAETIKMGALSIDFNIMKEGEIVIIL